MAPYSEIVNGILYFCGVIVTVWGAYKTVKEARKPKEELQETVKKHEALLEKNKAEIKEIKEGNKVICKSIMTMINHELSGNDVTNMKKVRDELQNYLIDK